MQSKLNCWEFMKCGREPGGKNAERIGVCPAVLEKRLDGMNGGKNAGRACWVVDGAICNGESRPTLASKIAACGGCDFYNLVSKEEYPNIMPIDSLIDKLSGRDACP